MRQAAYTRDGQLIGEGGMKTREMFYRSCENMVEVGFKHREFSVSAIVKACMYEMSTASFYQYWDSADELILEIYRDWINQGRFTSDKFYHMAQMIKCERKVR